MKSKRGQITMREVITAMGTSQTMKAVALSIGLANHSNARRLARSVGISRTKLPCGVWLVSVFK